MAFGKKNKSRPEPELVIDPDESVNPLPTPSTSDGIDDIPGLGNYKKLIGLPATQPLWIDPEYYFLPAGRISEMTLPEIRERHTFAGAYLCQVNALVGSLKAQLKLLRAERDHIEAEVFENMPNLERWKFDKRIEMNPSWERANKAVVKAEAQLAILEAEKENLVVLGETLSREQTSRQGEGRAAAGYGQ